MLLCPHKSLFCKFDFFITNDYVLGANLWSPIVWPLSVILSIWSPLDSLPHFGSLNGSSLQWLPHLCYEHSGLRKVQFYNTLCIFCADNFPQLFKIPLLNDLALLCNNFLISYTWNLKSQHFVFSKSNLSMTIYINIPSNSFYLRNEVSHIVRRYRVYFSCSLNTVTKTKLH